MLSGIFPQGALSLIVKRMSSVLESDFSAEDLSRFWDDLSQHGENWGYQPSSQVARQAIATLIDVAFDDFPLVGKEHVLEAVEKAKGGNKVVLVGNHLSYGDVNYLQALLYKNKIEGVPLLVMAGPKVYTDPFRRLSSMCFETIKMAQPPSRASDGADVSMRELAEITRTVLQDAETWQSKGRILYFFPEGSRSRSGGVERFISASARYCSGEDVWVYPVGYVGTENLLGVEKDEISLEGAKISIGKGLSYADFSKHLVGSPSRQRKIWMDFLGYGVASLLPKEMRGVYQLDGKAGDDEMEDARSLALTVFSPS